MNHNHLPSFAQRMELVRANKPASAGKVYPRRKLRQSDFDAKYPPDSIDRLEYFYDQWRKGIEERCLMAVETALFPEQYEELT